ncbi:MAG: type II secretion system protein GspG [Gemmatimonadales bacterium]|nr:type II secretion system protein GspG [Gemmatimonadales bacterium]
MNRTTNKGFSLIEVIIAVAIIAIMAGAIAPAVVKQINDQRIQATLGELAGINDGLLALYADLGRFPTQAEGLNLLVTSGALSGLELDKWEGPYVTEISGDVSAEITRDAFGKAYVYDASPTTDPTSAGNLVVASSGINQTAEMPDEATWVVDHVSLYDDLVIFVSSGKVDRNNQDTSFSELNAIAAAARSHYLWEGDFPTSLSDLGAIYLDSGFEDEAFRDQWQSDYLMAVSGGGSAVMTIWSCGPDRIDDTGSDDDLLVQVDSAEL